MYSCYSYYSILECYYVFSEIKLSISAFFYLFVHRPVDIFLILVGVELSLCVIVTLS